LFRVKDFYENLEDAKEAAKLGKAWAILYFPPDFSENLYQRYNQGKNASSDVLDESTIRVWLDMSSKFSVDVTWIRIRRLGFSIAKPILFFQINKSD